MRKMKFMYSTLKVPSPMAITYPCGYPRDLLFSLLNSLAWILKPLKKRNDISTLIYDIPVPFSAEISNMSKEITLFLKNDKKKKKKRVLNGNYQLATLNSKKKKKNL